MKSKRAISGCVVLGVALLTLTTAAAEPTQCRDSGDPFIDYYSSQAGEHIWYITSVTPDHEDHGIHLMEGDMLMLDVTADCEVVLTPGPALAQRWGAQRRQLVRQSGSNANGGRASHTLCTTVGLGHESMGTPDMIARPHLMRLTTIDVNGYRTLEIRYGHRSTMQDDCENDGLLDNVHGGTAHAQD